MQDTSAPTGVEWSLFIRGMKYNHSESELWVAGMSLSISSIFINSTSKITIASQAIKMLRLIKTHKEKIQKWKKDEDIALNQQPRQAMQWKMTGTNDGISSADGVKLKKIKIWEFAEYKEEVMTKAWAPG